MLIYFKLDEEICEKLSAWNRFLKNIFPDRFSIVKTMIHKI